MMDFTGHMSTGAWVFSILGILILVALVVGVTIVLVSALNNRGAHASGSAESAREILDRRLANGELTVEQYDRLRTALGDQVQSRPDPQPRRPADAPS
jgi:putative membrane protein